MAVCWLIGDLNPRGRHWSNLATLCRAQAQTTNRSFDLEGVYQGLDAAEAACRSSRVSTHSLSGKARVPPRPSVKELCTRQADQIACQRGRSTFIALSEEGEEHLGLLGGLLRAARDPGAS